MPALTVVGHPVTAPINPLMPAPSLNPGVLIEEGLPVGQPISGGSTSVTAFVGPARRGTVNRAVRIQSLNDYERHFGPLGSRWETGYAVMQYFLNGGHDAWVVRVALHASLAKIRKALRALDAIEPVNLLVLPGNSDPAVREAAAGYCFGRRAFLIADPPAAQTPAQMAIGLAPAVGEWWRNAAIYYPWIRIADPANGGQPRVSAPSGTVAGLFVRTDINRGCWKAPAGVDATLAGVVGLELALGDAENGQLSPLGVNCLRKFANLPVPVVWGARTMRGADALTDEYKYIPVRRLALYIEESLTRGLNWAVFEPNAEPLWAKLRDSVSNFLNEMFRQGAFQGSKAAEAYFVKCDSATSTPGDLAAGLVNLQVGFAPMKPAEFVVLRIQLRAGPAGA